jgi:hypothetical protein
VLEQSISSSGDRRDCLVLVQNLLHRVCRGDKAVSQMEARNTQYAVIQARWAGRPTECFPITYEDEEALRAILASSSILACGIASRERALAVVQHTFSIAHGTNRLPASAICESRKLKRNLRGTIKEEREGAFSWERARAALSDLISRTAGAAILFICSKNVFCGLLRAVIGV